jgi:hypothetical protein
MKGHTLGHHSSHHEGKHHAAHHVEGDVHHHHYRKGGKAKKRATGGRDLAVEDVEDRPEERTNAREIDREAEEKRRGGRAKRAHGGHVHHEKMSHLKHAKHVGKVHGEHAHHHAGRRPRKAGGRTGSDQSPFSSARHGKAGEGRKEEMEFE